MEENAPRQWHLQSPLRDEDIAQLTAGDLVYLTGPAYTARDGVYQHMLVDGNPPPVDIAGLTNVSFQSSPAGAVSYTHLRAHET